jgi:TonB-dependent starch-binding outer membrane protein SusC
MQKKGILCSLGRLLYSPKPNNLQFFMKVGALILVSFITVAQMMNAAPGYGQGNLNQKINLNFKKELISTVFESIRQQADVSFSYEETGINKYGRINIVKKEISVSDALDLILKEKNLQWRLVNGVILISAKSSDTASKIAESNSVIISPVFQDIPPVDIRGRVINEKGEAVAGATVMIKGSKRATSTDADGNFMLNGVEEKAQLIVTGANIENEEVNVKGQSLLNITVQQKLSSLDQIQIIAYGTTTKRLSTGSISTVKAADIEKQPVSNPLQALQGRIPGLAITQNTGIPGGSFNVQIRGQNSLPFIGKTNDPFYVIDGVPYNAQLAQQPLSYALLNGSPFNFINPNDIESIEILKDADATSIYGSRAANGAILITTKKGKAGAMKLDINFYTGNTKSKKGIKTLNTDQYLEMREEAFKNDDLTPGISDYDVNGTWDKNRYTDWIKVLEQNRAHFTNANVNLSGGNMYTQYLIGATYSKQETGYPRLLKNDGSDQKATVHFNINSISANNKFKISLTGSYMSDRNTAQSGIYNSYSLSLLTPPNAPSIYNDDGSLNWAPKAPGERGTWGNPFARLLSSTKGVNANLVSNIVVSYQLSHGLEVKSSFGYTNLKTDETNIFPLAGEDPGAQLTSGSSAFQATNNKSWIAEPQLNYELQLGKSKLTTLLGSTFQESNKSVQILNASSFASDALLANIQSAGSILSTSSSAQYKYNGIFGRLNYNWQDKYIINFNVRRDGSSRFGPGKQFHSFTSIGGAWIFTEENFIKEHISFLSFGKLRGSYGTTGSDGLPEYQFLDLFTSNSGLPYQGSTGLYPANQFNPDLAWEETRKFDVALQLDFFKNRISVEAAYYRNRSDNQLVSTPLSLVTGYDRISTNLPALVQNAGVEFIFTSINIKSKNFQWTSSFNISANRNKLVAFPRLSSSFYSGYNYIIGKPLSIIKLFNYGGVNSTSGVYQFINSNGDLVDIPDDPTDRTATVDLTPKYFGGFQNTFTYKNFNLDFLFQFINQKGQNFYATYLAPGMMYNQPVDILDRWQKPGDQATFQKYTTTFGPASTAFYFAQQSTWAYSTASFIRLKNLSLSWQLPGNWKEKAHVKNCSVYIQGQNLLTITNYKGMDPESQGLELPPVKVWTAGIRVTL